MNHEKFMRAALRQAQKAFAIEEVPVGAVAVIDSKIIARAHNRRETLKNPVAHAELICLQKAAQKLGGWRLNKVTLYCTLEPCLMCAGALKLARVTQLVYGAKDPQIGAVKHLDSKIKITSGILGEECKKILKDFFIGLRRSG